MRSYHNIPKEGPLPDSLALNLIHGYYSCVSFVDSQIGKVLNALEELGLAENTVIVLWGDNGWFLGEHGFWSKHSNFKIGSHVPLIVKVPWKKSSQKIEEPVESVDVYPTLCELAELDFPFHLQGKSLVPLMNNKKMHGNNIVFYRNGNGETIISGKYAYTEWIDDETGQITARMLYNHMIDPEENTNIAEVPENKTLVQELHNKLQKHLIQRDIINISSSMGKE